MKFNWHRHRVRQSIRRSLRHPCDRGWLSDYEVDLILYWRRATAHRRHGEPFNKTMKGHARRQARRFVRQQDQHK